MVLYVCVRKRENKRGGKSFSPAIFTQIPDRSDSMTFSHWTTCPHIQYYEALCFSQLKEVVHSCAEDTLHSELDEPSALSIGVDGVAGEKDRISSLGWVQL